MKSYLYPLSNYVSSGELPVKVFFHEQQISSMHYHDFVELVFVRSGYGKHICEGQSYSISRGDVFVIKPSVKHKYDDAHDLSIINLLIDFSSPEIILNDLKQSPGFYALFEVEPLLRARRRNFPRFQLSSDDFTLVCKYLKEIEQESLQKLPGYRCAALNSFTRLLVLLARRYEQPQQKVNGNMMRLSMMLQFIEENYMRDITRDDIVQSAFVSSSTGSRIFQEILGKTIIEYLTQTRIDHAAEKLRGDSKVSDVAFECGFRDSNYFSSVFTKRMGKSPSAYRNLIAEKK